LRQARHSARHPFRELLHLLRARHAAAEAEQGELGQAESDVLRVSGQVTDVLEDHPELHDAMRPVYIEYLLKHSKA